AVDGLEPGRARNDDVFAELAGELLTLLVELFCSGRTFLLDGLENLLREGEELVVVRHGLGLTADRDDDSALAVVGEAVADLALGCLAPRALGGTRHAALAEELLGRIQVPVRLLERALALHEAGPCSIAELLDECSRDLGHCPASVVSWAPTCSYAGSSAVSSALGASASGAGSGSSGCLAAP